ncbi:IclR family transcriptional regulator domain-containing protein [Streptomyces canus]|uniref:IclR family transcriptional regulator domain-containing protein n=1 Tax=Streptomyces canus TaxID=58343 RepID=UPI0027808A32|nr:IclR family transcriptional regulator C-terminal domain-containing protein [Streptomyces canus]MDQ0758810.1 hypothetical protein [Streptomyces canus]
MADDQVGGGGVADGRPRLAVAPVSRRGITAVIVRYTRDSEVRGWCSQSRVPAARCPQDTDLADHVPNTLKPLTPNTHTDHDALIKDLRATAERGYATDNEENFVGVVCYGFSLRFTTPRSTQSAARSPSTGSTPARTEELIEAMRLTRLSIERMAPIDHTMP